MQLLNYSPWHTSDNSNQPVLAIVEDITSKIEIKSDFCIGHPDYKPLKFPDEIVSRFQRLPVNIQHKIIGWQLCNFLYGIYYNNASRSALSLDAETQNSLRLQNLENNTYLGVDLEFYQRLHSSNKGQGYFDVGWQVTREEMDGSLAVKKHDLTLYIERDRHLQDQEKNALTGSLVSIKMPRNLLQNGFYMAVGDAGLSNHTLAGIDSQLVRVYFNLNPEGAILVMDSLTRQLNTRFIPFTFKALYNPSDYERYDTAVLYFQRSYYPVIRQVLQFVYTEYQSHFSEEIPLFTKCLAPGLALAEEPNNKFSQKESFGLNRCQIVTNSLLEAWQQGDESKENRLTLIMKHFTSEGIKLDCPYLNSNSEDIYAPLESVYCDK